MLHLVGLVGSVLEAIFGQLVDHQPTRHFLAALAQGAN